MRYSQAILAALMPALAIPSMQADIGAQATLLRTRAADVSGIRAEGQAPFSLHARLRLETDSGPKVGRYLLVWEGPSRWRQQVSFPDYEETHLEGTEGVWRSSSTGYQPARVYEILQALSFDLLLINRMYQSPPPLPMTSYGGGVGSGQDPAGGEPDATSRVVRQTVEDRELICVVHQEVFETCFDEAEGTLAWARTEFQTTEFLDYAPWGDRRFPRTIRVSRAVTATVDRGDGPITAVRSQDELVAEISIDGPPDLTTPDPEGFGPPEGAAWAEYPGGVDIVSPKVIRETMVNPEYTPAATRRGLEGTVSVEAIVNANGRVVEPRIVQGLPDDELNSRAMQAVREWRFEPATKRGETVPVVAVFTMTYRLGGRSR